MANRSKKRILAIGLEPPPLGGVTVFFSRWVAEKRRIGVEVDVIEYRKRSRFISRLIMSIGEKYDEILINSLSGWIIGAVRMFHPRTSILVVDHNASRRLGASGSFRRRVRLSLLKLADKILLVSDHLRANYGEFEGDFVTISSFVPPDEGRRDVVLSTYSARTLQVLQSRSGPLLVVAAWRPIIENGRDLYGLKDSLRLLKHLLPSFPDLHLLMFIGEFLENEISHQLRACLDHPELRDHLHIEVGNKELWPALTYADAVLRMTATDGNSVSVHEALWAGCRVVASDVVPRPPGVQIYPYDQFHELVEQVVLAIEMGRRSQ